MKLLSIIIGLVLCYTMELGQFSIWFIFLRSCRSIARRNLLPQTNLYLPKPFFSICV